MSAPRALALLALLAPLAAGCVPGATDPATIASRPASTSRAATTTAARPDPAARAAADLDACDVYREAVSHFDAMGKGSNGVFDGVRDATRPQDRWLEGKSVSVDEHWGRRISEALTKDVSPNVRAALEKAVETGHTANTMLVQLRPDEQYKPASKRADWAADSADKICATHKN